MPLGAFAVSGVKSCWALFDHFGSTVIVAFPAIVVVGFTVVACGIDIVEWPG